MAATLSAISPLNWSASCRKLAGTLRAVSLLRTMEQEITTLAFVETMLSGHRVVVVDQGHWNTSISWVQPTNQYIDTEI